MKDPSLRQIRYFTAVANAGQVSRAARQLNVSQSALTNAVKQLEEIIGVSLFVRHGSGVTLTYEGNIFLDHALRVMSVVEEAVRSPGRKRDDVKGRLRLAITYTVAGYFIPPYIERFQRAFPGVEVDLTEAPRARIEDGLVSGSFDLAVMLTSNIVDQEGLEFETLIQSRRRLWLASRHPLLSQPSVTLADVAREPYRGRGQQYRTAVLEPNRVPTQLGPAHLIGGGCSILCGRWHGGNDLVRHGLSALVVGRSASRSDPLGG